MNIITIIFIALGLSMDAFAVSVASGVIIKKQRLYNAFKFGFCFSLFQMIMPLLGWASGIALRRFITEVDHWIAFVLLSIVGCKMIYEAMGMESFEKREDYFTKYVLFALSIATSIDALVVGVSFAFLNVSIIIPVLIIGLVTFIMSYSGFLIGNKFGHIFEKKIEIVGGLILIGMGLKILFEHLF